MSASPATELTPDLARAIAGVAGDGNAPGAVLAIDDAAPLGASFIMAGPSLRTLFADEDLDLATIMHTHQDVHLLRPLLIGDVVTTEPSLVRVEPAVRGSRCSIRTDVLDADGRMVAVIWSGISVRAERPSVKGLPAPSHQRRIVTAEIVELGVEVPGDQAQRYALVSGDDNPIHLDPVAADAAGFDGPILHGACLLALVIERLCTVLGAPRSAVSRFAARFTAPVRPGSTVAVTARMERRDDGRVVVQWDAKVDQRRVMRDGLLDLRYSTTSSEPSERYQSSSR